MTDQKAKRPDEGTEGHGQKGQKGTPAQKPQPFQAGQNPPKQRPDPAQIGQRGDAPRHEPSHQGKGAKGGKGEGKPPRGSTQQAGQPPARGGQYDAGGSQSPKDTRQAGEEPTGGEG